MTEEINSFDIERAFFDIHEFAAKEQVRIMNPFKKHIDANANLIIEGKDGKKGRLHVLDDDGKYHDFNRD